jgi:hypothetical protein
MLRRVALPLVLLAFTVATAMPVSALVAPVRDVLPDGGRRPVVVSATLMAPQRHNALLEADIAIEATDDDGIDRYEYRWVGAGNAEPAVIDSVAMTVAYDDVRPATDYRLQVRAVDTDGWESDWYDAWEGTTPPPPRLIVAGDSVASGYSRDWFTRPATCRDDEYAYGETVVAGIAAHLPSAWAPAYFNLAWPGAGVEDMIEGGTDSCGQSHPSQLGGIVALADPKTWNVVVVTAGVNSTNWTDVISELVKNTAISLSESGDREWCTVAVNERWNLAERSDAVTDSVRSVVTSLHDETNAAIHWTSYYPIDGTVLAPGWTPVGAECAPQMDEALARLHAAILTGIGNGAEWIDISAEQVTTQKWAGWPHPNRAGHALLGNQIARAIAG